VETNDTLRDNGPHPGQNRLGVALQAVKSRTGLLLGGTWGRATPHAGGGRP
jgi:hypothetical protein